MSVSEQMLFAEVKNRLSEVVERLEREHGRIVITKHGHQAVPAVNDDADYAIAWTATSRRSLARLPGKVATAVAEFSYGSVARTPRRAGKPPQFGLAGSRSARRGDYRVIYRRDDGLRTVTVMATEHRSDGYRPPQP